MDIRFLTTLQIRFINNSKLASPIFSNNWKIVFAGIILIGTMIWWIALQRSFTTYGQNQHPD